MPKQIKSQNRVTAGMCPPDQSRSVSWRLRVITALEWSGNAQTSALAPQFVVDSLVAAVVEVVVDVDDVGEGVVALRGVLNAFVQTVSDHLKTRERFL